MQTLNDSERQPVENPSWIEQIKGIDPFSSEQCLELLAVARRHSASIAKIYPDSHFQAVVNWEAVSLPNAQDTRPYIRGLIAALKKFVAALESILSVLQETRRSAETAR